MSPSIAYARARCVEERFVAPKEKESNPIAAKLRADGSVCFRVLGASMFPWIRSGDLVFVRRFAYEQASRGDVVLFERADRPSVEMPFCGARLLQFGVSHYI